MKRPKENEIGNKTLENQKKEGGDIYLVWYTLELFVYQSFQARTSTNNAFNYE